MDGHDVLRDREELRDRVAPFLEADEHLDVVLRASSRPAKALKLVAMEAWPFFHEKDKFLLVATDRRWLVLESDREGFEGPLRIRSIFDRAVRVETSWLTRFDGFDQPYSVDPVYALWAVAANRAHDARAAGGTWDLADDADTITAADNDPMTESLSRAVQKVGRFLPGRGRG